LALLLSSDPDLTASEQEAALLESAVDLGAPGPDDETGYGRLDVLAAYLWLQIAHEEDVTGPVTESATLAPNPNDGTVDVALSATADDSATGGSNIDAAEYFIGTVGADGSGTAMTVGAAAPTTSLDAVIPAATANTLAAGTHVVSVHSRDTAGNWGPFDTVELVIDKTAPEVVLVAPVNGSVVAVPVSVSGSASDDVGVVEVRVEIYNRDLPQTRWWNGSGWQADRTFVNALLGSPGGVGTDWEYVFDPPEAAVRAYWVTVRAFDAAGNMSNRPATNFKIR